MVAHKYIWDRCVDLKEKKIKCFENPNKSYKPKSPFKNFFFLIETSRSPKNPQNLRAKQYESNALLRVF